MYITFYSNFSRIFIFDVFTCVFLRLLQSCFIYIVVHPKLQAYTYLVGKDQSADEHLCIKTASYEASAEDISYTAASHATRTISLFRPNPSYFSPPGCLFPAHPSLTKLPSGRSATVSVHPSFPIVAPVSPDDYRSSALSSLGQRDFIKLLLRAHRRHFASLASPSSLLPALRQLLHAK